VSEPGAGPASGAGRRPLVVAVADLLRRPPRWLATVGIVAGLSLLALALLTVWSRRELVAEALRTVEDRSAWWAVALVGLVLANLVLSVLLFSVLSARYGRVGLLEMQAIIASTWLLNFLPLRPGLMGRLAWHRAVNDIRVIDTARTLVQAAVISVGMAILLVAGTVGAVALTGSPWPGVALPGPPMLAALAWPSMRRWTAAAAIRYLELVVWAARYVLAFWMLGLELPIPVGFVLAGVSTVATMVPFISNGLGLREWAVGLTVPVVSNHVAVLAISADLLNRAAELVAAVLAGVPALLVLTARGRRGPGPNHRTNADHPETPAPNRPGDAGKDDSAASPSD